MLDAAFAGTTVVDAADFKTSVVDYSICINKRKRKIDDNPMEGMYESFIHKFLSCEITFHATTGDITLG